MVYVSANQSSFSDSRRCHSSVADFLALFDPTRQLKNLLWKTKNFYPPVRRFIAGKINYFLGGLSSKLWLITGWYGWCSYQNRDLPNILIKLLILMEIQVYPLSRVNPTWTGGFWKAPILGGLKSPVNYSQSWMINKSQNMITSFAG